MAAAAPTVLQPGFETPSVASQPNALEYNPAGSAWTFAGNAGIAANGNAYDDPSVNGSAPAPEGSQKALFVGSGGVASQSIAGWPAGAYTLGAQFCQRQNNTQDFALLVDGNQVGAYTPAFVAAGGGTAQYSPYTSPPFTVAAGTHTIAIAGLDTKGGDNTGFADAVVLTLVAALPTAATLAAPSSTSGPAGAESGAFTVTLDEPAPAGGQVIALDSSAAGDSFRATSGGAAVTALTIPAGSTSATFLLVPLAAGTSQVSIAAGGLTVAGSPASYVASAASAPATPPAGGYRYASAVGSVPAGLTPALAVRDLLTGAAVAATVGPLVPQGPTAYSATFTTAGAGNYLAAWTVGALEALDVPTALGGPAAAATGGVKVALAGQAAGLIGTAGFGYTLLDANLAPVDGLVTTGIVAATDTAGTTYVAVVPPATFAVRWSVGAGTSFVQVAPDAPAPPAQDVPTAADLVAAMRAEFGPVGDAVAALTGAVTIDPTTLVATFHDRAGVPRFTTSTNRAVVIVLPGGGK